MPSWGGFAGVFPIRFGGAVPPLRHRFNAVIGQLGSFYNTNPQAQGLVWLRAMALARALNDVWESNKRLSYQWDPLRMTDFLGRWEAIFSLPVSPSDSMPVRRARVAIAMGRSGYARNSDIYSVCLAYLGPSVFIGISTQSSATALVYTPTGWPVGTNEPLGSVSPPDWYSTISHIDILTQTPASMNEADWRQLVGSVKPELDAILPSWVTFDIIRDGPNGNGFFCDDPHNLDFERLG
jgi:hypothetical protein